MCKITFDLSGWGPGRQEGRLETIMSNLSSAALDVEDNFHKKFKNRLMASVPHFDLFRFELLADGSNGVHFRAKVVLSPSVPMGSLQDPKMEIDLPRAYLDEKPQQNDLVKSMEETITSRLKGHYGAIKVAVERQLTALE